MRQFFNKKPQFKKLIKFGTVGAICVIVDFSVVYMLFEKLFINKYVANASSTAIGLTVNYLLNRMWTFRSKEPWRKEFIRFALIGCVGLALNNLIVFFGNDYMHYFLYQLCQNSFSQLLKSVCDNKMRWSFYLIKMTAILLVFFWNFYVNSKFNFKPR